MDPLIVAAYDAELFGHWWFEGPQFLAFVLREIAARDELICVTPSGYLRHDGAGRRGAEQAGRPALSTWGDRGYFEVWVNGSNDWTYRHLRQAESAMVGAAARFGSADGLRGRALNQCARQLMLAQSSDWPFLMSTGTAEGYATRRFNDLIGRFSNLLGQVRSGRIDRAMLQSYEWLDDAFPEMDFKVFGPLNAAALRPPIN